MPRFTLDQPSAARAKYDFDVLKFALGHVSLDKVVAIIVVAHEYHPMIVGGPERVFLALCHPMPSQLLLDVWEMDKLPDANHRLLHIKATQDSFAFDGVKFASHYVEEALKQQLLKYDVQQVRAMESNISVPSVGMDGIQASSAVKCSVDGGGLAGC